MEFGKLFYIDGQKSPQHGSLLLQRKCIQVNVVGAQGTGKAGNAVFCGQGNLLGTEAVLCLDLRDLIGMEIVRAAQLLPHGLGIAVG